MRKINNLSKILDVALTRSCNYNCSWCNQRYDLTKPMYDMKDSPRLIVNNKIRSGSEWIEGLNANPWKDEYDKLVFSGGEPSLHQDFFDIVANVKGYKSKIVVTNLSFDVNKLISACQAAKTHVIVQPSFHFEFVSFDTFLGKMMILDKYHMLSHFIPASIVDLPDRKEPRNFANKFREKGYGISVYKFEGYYKGKFIYADIKGFGSLGDLRSVYCSSCGHFVCPNGDIVFCPSDTYSDGNKPYGNICDKIYKRIETRRVCDYYGACHISSASWIKVESLETQNVIWKGKNFRNRNLLNLFRMYFERKNYRWLAKIKNLYNNFFY